MAACRDIISQNFPDIDQEIADYVNGLLEGGGDDIDTADDLFDAIGPMLHQGDGNKSDNDIREICSRLHSVLVNGASENGLVVNGQHKKLDTPVHMAGLMDASSEGLQDEASIWMKKREDPNRVDQKRLEKAQAQQKKKTEKRAEQEALPRRNDSCSNLKQATASQQIDRKDAKMDASGTNRSYDIKIEDFDISFGEKTLMSGASVHLVAGRRYGFVGRNGLGKTTLLKMISSGQLKIPSHITVLHVEQEVAGDDTEALQSVLTSDTKREALMQEEKEILAKLNTAGAESGDLGARLSEVCSQLEAMEAAKAPSRAAIILSGLGFASTDQTRPTREFSGGWRMRLALAQALFSKPDLLLLDEPTNMLDMKAIIWLENYLQTWATTIMVVSHDRQFLNAVSTDILHLHSQRIDCYRGNYEVFHKTREEKLKNQQKEFEAQMTYREHIQQFIDRFRYNANRASQVQSKIKLLEKLPPVTPVLREADVVMKFKECEKLSPPILQLDEVCFHYISSNPIFRNICINAGMDSRICIVGENGAGKTTLLKLLLGNLDPTSGIRHAHRSLRIGYFSQHHVDQLDMSVSSVELLAKRFPGQSSEVYRGELGSFGVSGELALRPVASLSGGQKSRVAFAIMCMATPNFFILDEPTNHLDMETIEALGESIYKFKGGVVLVSHDERLIRKVCRELWVVGNGTVKSLEGGFDEYKEIVEQELQAQGC